MNKRQLKELFEIFKNQLIKLDKVEKFLSEAEVNTIEEGYEGFTNFIDEVVMSSYDEETDGDLFKFAEDQIYYSVVYDL